MRDDIFKHLTSKQQNNAGYHTFELYSIPCQLTTSVGEAKLETGTSQLVWEHNGKEWKLTTSQNDTGFKTSAHGPLFSWRYALFQRGDETPEAVVEIPIRYLPPNSNAPVFVKNYITDNKIYLESPDFRFGWKVFPTKP